MRTGNYDGVSASGDATLRLIAAEDVAAGQPRPRSRTTRTSSRGSRTSRTTRSTASRTASPHGRGANLLIWNTDDVTPAPHDSWTIVWDADSPAAGKISVYDSPIYIADAAVYLKTTQPDLKITDPYELDEEQFNAAVNLLKEQKKIVGEYWSDAAKQIQSFTSGDSTAGTTWQYQVNQLQGAKEPVPVEAIAAGGGLDRLVGHVDDRVQGRRTRTACTSGWTTSSARRRTPRRPSTSARRPVTEGGVQADAGPEPLRRRSTQRTRTTSRRSTTGRRRSPTAATTGVTSARTTRSGRQAWTEIRG